MTKNVASIFQQRIREIIEWRVSKCLICCIWLTTLLITFPAYAVDISQCWMVAEDRAEIITFEALRNDGTNVTLSGLMAHPEGTGPFPAIVMVHGSNGLFTPLLLWCYCRKIRQLGVHSPRP